MAKKKILLVDDEEAFGRMVKMNLEKTGDFEVRVEQMASRSLQTAQEFKPDLILMDIMMRDLAGPAAVQQIRSDPRFQNTPLVYLSAALPKKEGQEEKDTFAGHPYIAKPVTAEELIACIEKHMRT